MATFASTQYGLKATGFATKVPDNPVSKLKYYMNSVLTLIDVGNDSRFRQIQNYDSSDISVDDFVALLQLCAILQPDIFLNKCLFIAPELCGNNNNQFYQISQVTNVLGVGNGVIIGGTSKKITKIMTCNKEWLLRNYYLPLQIISKAIEDAQNQQQANNRRIQKRNQSDGCCSIM